MARARRPWPAPGPGGAAPGAAVCAAGKPAAAALAGGVWAEKNRHMHKCFQSPLPYPLIDVPLKNRPGVVLRKYVIPPEDKEKVLAQLWFFMEKPPKLSARLCDIECGKVFRVGDFDVYREGTMNVLASPYYPESGGTVIDWVPPSWADK